MGLDTTHNAWHGAYSAFNRFRAHLAASIGLVLGEMINHGGVEQRPWPTDEPLVILLDHSDCDGEITSEDCAFIAKRLREVAPSLPAYGYGHMPSVRGAAIQFAIGCESAAAADEPLEFC